MSHNGSEEYFNSIGVVRENYFPIHLSVILIEPSSFDFSFHAELLLADRAIAEDCEYVTNLDYCQADYDQGRLIIVGTGWRIK
jgi:hypothetical protein